MKIHFNIHYLTIWGQSLAVSGNIPELGNDDFSKALILTYHNIGEWLGEIEVKLTENVNLNYKYVLINANNGLFTEEWGENRELKLVDNFLDDYFFFDTWNSPHALENTFLSAPFAKILIPDEHEIVTVQSQSNFTHIFQVFAPTITRSQVVCIVGDCEKFGNWSIIKPLLLSKTENGYWEVKVDLSKVQGEVHYKYGLYDPEDNKFCCFETGEDRIVTALNAKKSIVQMNDGFIRITGKEWRGAGVGLPVFSIRTKKSFGVGDFGDLLLFVDWAKKSGLKLIQVLPLNDTIGTHTDADVLPYAAISAFALNPLFLNLPTMGKLPATNPLQQEYKALQPKVNAEELIQFLDVINFKLKYASELYQVQKDKFLRSKDFQAFFKKNEFWLVPYAAYCVLRDENGTSDYRLWKDFAHFDKNKIEIFTSSEQSYYDKVAVNYFIQYHLHLQLLKASEYAHQKGIILKGDIPIGVNRNSVDTWVSPELFHMHMQAGAPPDMFAVKGQNWELPTYNWEMMHRTGYNWWKMRFAQLSNYFDTFRIDHILGFFRIWQIPYNQLEGIMGHLYPSRPIQVNEFAERGISFDFNRFCKPYITDSILWDFFGEEAAWVKANCMQIEDGWVLRLKTPYQHQLNVEKLFQEGKFTERVKNGLFNIISNVLFFEVEGSNGTQFYPRYGMESLHTYQELDGFIKTKISELYVDYFYRRQDAFWYQSGMEKLPALKRATNMLICGEDLGMMTKCVTTVMNELGILSLEVQRAPKSDKLEFFHPDNAPYLSVVTPSTHDMSTIRGWWEEDRAITQRFYTTQLGHRGEVPYYCEPWICRDILLQHLYSPAMWAIFQMQDLMSISEKLRRENPIDERINVPSNSKFSWRFRLHISMEDLLDNDAFNNELKNYIVQSGR